MDTTRKEQLLMKLESHPGLKACFAPHVAAICDNGRGDLRDYDIIWGLEVSDSQWMDELERRIQAARTLLGIASVEELAHEYRFDSELAPRKAGVAPDTEKANDLFTELLFVVDFDRLGFANIKRLKPLGSRRQPLATADYKAQFRGEWVAIEVKTVRRDEREEEQSARIPRIKPSWWVDAFASEILQKIHDDDDKALRQLRNTCTHLVCTKKLLAVCVRKSLIALMGDEHYAEALGKVKQQVPELDYICTKEYDYGKVVLCPP